MKLNKILALVLAMALLCTSFAACGDAASSGSTASTAGTSSAADASEAGSSDTSSVESKAATGTGDADATALFQPKTVDPAKSISVRSGMEPTGLNTLKATYSIEFSLFKHLYENLYMLDENDVPQLAAAESVDIAADGMKYTFTLRQDGKWTNGDPVTANDFSFAWSQALSADVAADYAYFLFFIKNAEAYYNGEAKWEDVGIKVLDDYTLEVELQNPTPYAPFLFTFGTLLPINQRFYEAVGADNYNTEAQYFCTNGAFALTEWAHDNQIVLQKNDGFYNAADYEVEQITFKIISDGQAALTAYLAGELDMTELPTGEIIKQAEAAGKTVQTYSDGGTFYVYFNHKNQYLSNNNLRTALALAIDKQGMLDTVHQNADVAMTSFTSPTVNGYDGKSFRDALEAEKGLLTPVNGDEAKAKEALAAALTELGCTVEDLSANLSLDCGDGAASQAEAAFYQNQWLEKLGINVTINPMITKQGSANRRDGNYVMSLTGWGPDYNDPMTFLDLWQSEGGNNQTGFADAEYDDLLAKATMETDLAKRQEYFVRMEEIIVEKLPVAPVWWRIQAFSTSDKIKGGVIRTTFQDLNVSKVKLS